MWVKSHSVLKKNYREQFIDAHYHIHGRPNLKRRNSRYALPETKIWFHAIPQLAITNDGEVIFRDKFYSVLYKDAITAKRLSMQICHFLGLKWGTSIVWKEVNSYTLKAETHTVCFDGSGLDISHESNVHSLIKCAIETGLKDRRLLTIFALRHSINGYIQAWRGNKLLLTSKRENALKAYLKKENLLEYYSEMKNIINDYPRDSVNFPELT